MFKIEAVVNGDQLETLLLAAKAAGVTLSLGVHLEEPLRRRRASPKPSTKKRPKQKYPAKMQVLVGSHVGLTPALERARGKLRAEFGGNPFQKHLARKILKTKGGSLVRELMDRGGLIPA